MAANHFAIALLTALAVAAPGAVAAQIDVSGRWHLTFFAPIFGVTGERSLTLAQDGATLTVTGPVDANYFGGTIDPSSGALRLDGAGTCANIGEVLSIPWRIDGVASSDGATITGTFNESVQPTRSCLLITGTVHGERLPESCGDGVVDAGEGCDVGPTGDACCSEFCTPRTAGTACGAGDVCFTAACDGTGGCALAPRPAGTLCRLADGACDTAEVCDGVSTTCPAPTRPTEPDVDADGILDPCDDCVGQPIERAQLRIGRFNRAPARDFVYLSARIRLAPGASLPDPPSTWKLVELRDATGAPILYAQVPGGDWDPDSGAGWRRHGSRWTFRTNTPVLGMVSRLSLVPSKADPAVYDVLVATPRASLTDVAPVLPLDLTLILDGLGPSARCGQRRLAAPACRATNGAGVIRCR